MNWIDGYCGDSMPYESGREQEELCLPLSPSDDAPFYLRFLQAKLRAAFPRLSSSIFSPSSDHPSPILGLLDPLTRGRFQFWAEVVLSEESQSILVRGGMLVNGVSVGVKGRARVVMAARAVHNLNQQLSPIKLSLNPKTGSLALVHCCYIDAEFAKLHSPKNINYLAFKVAFVLQTLIAHHPLLIFLSDPHAPEAQLPPNLAGSFNLAQIEAEETLRRVESSLELMHLDLQTASGELDSTRKKDSMLPTLNFLEEDLEAVLPLFTTPRTPRPALVRLANEHYSPDSLLEYATPLEKRLKFRICSRIHLSDYGYFRWE
jgi:hypothetical protein